MVDMAGYWGGAFVTALLLWEIGGERREISRLEKCPAGIGVEGAAHGRRPGGE